MSGHPAHPRYELGGASLRHALIAGAEHVIRARDALNRINVFPVPDGDTGTNMASTFSAMRAGMQGLRRASVANVLRTAADEAIDGARGNSGAIVAQFFSSLAQSLCRSTRVALPELSVAIHEAAIASRRALSDPKEGTILSVMSAFAAGLQSRGSQGRVGLRALFGAGLAQARRALARTPRQLRVLAQAGVVDAGGQGFVDFLEGVHAFIEKRRGALDARETSATDAPEADFSHPDHALSETFRYCSECVIEGCGLEADSARALLHGMGLDSLVLAGGGTRLKIHAHTDTPALLFERLAPLGRIYGRKADDMHAQSRARAHAGGVYIVTDSAADLPPQAHALPIQVVPVRVNFGRDEFLDRITLPHSELYRRLEHDPEPVRTSQPPSGDFKRMYETLSSAGHGVLSLHISAGLSGTWQAAQSAAQRVAEQIVVLDTGNAGCGQGLLVEMAGMWAQAGLAPNAIAERVYAQKPHAKTFALIADLRYGVHGGRIPKWLGWLSRKLGFGVVIHNHPGGKIKPWRVLLGANRRSERFVASVLRQMRDPGGYRVLVGHCAAPESGAHVYAQLARHAAVQRIDLIEAGPAIGAHAGPGTVVIGLLPIAAYPDASLTRSA